MVSIQSFYFPPFEVDGADSSSLGPRWHKYLDRFKLAVEAYNVTADNRQKALLLTWGGERLQEIFSTLPDTGTKFQEAVDALTKYFSPRKNIIYQRFHFRQARQHEGENVDAYCTRLKTLGEFCEFENLDSEVMEHIILSCQSSVLRQKALAQCETVDDFKLSNLLTIARSLELSQTQSSAIEAPSTNDVHAVKTVKQVNNQQQSTKSVSSNKHHKKDNKLCYFCGYDYPHNGECPAKGKSCNYCGGANHFERACHKKSREAAEQQQHKVSALTVQHSEENEFTF